MEEGYEGLQPLLSKNVIVLAPNFKLSKAQYQVLNRGLTFIPSIDTNKDTKLKLQFDIQNYHRKLKLAAYFKNNQRAKPKFMPRSHWIPPEHKLPPEVQFTIKKDNKYFKNNCTIIKEKPNLLVEEIRAIKELKENKHIVIKPADKGSAVVILGRDQYIREVNRQLNDDKYYTKLQEPIYLETVPLVYKIVHNLFQQKFINKKQKQYLLGDREPRARRFYILPKIHKDPQTWTIPYQIPPGRPIVSDCNSETYQTAEYIDYYLNPLSVKHPSYLRDTYHFVNIIKNLKISNKFFFFSIDIDSLYTNIDIGAGLTAVKNTFDRYPDQNRPDKEILQLLEINLTRNDFEFNGEFYLQIKGTAMGKRFAPAYANIFMAKWESEALNKCPRKPLHYYRYLDDIFGIWTYSEEEFLEFINILNTHDDSIKLKFVKNEVSIDFLDTTIYKGEAFQLNNTLDIKVYFKDTDTHALLFKTSFHPQHTFKGLIKSQLIRFGRICTQKNDFFAAVRVLFRTLRTRGYSRTFLRRCLRTFEVRKPRESRIVIPLITTYSTLNQKINTGLKANYKNFIEEQGILPNHRIILAYNKNKNLRDLLVRARLEPLQNQKLNILSKQFRNLTYVQNSVTKQIFKISQSFSTLTRNCVYMIYCAICGLKYIGETKNSISIRMMQHRYHIKNKKQTHLPLVQHFIRHDLPSLMVAGLQSNSSWTDAERKKVERRWIYWLGTREPNGLNF